MLLILYLKKRRKQAYGDVTCCYIKTIMAPKFREIIVPTCRIACHAKINFMPSWLNRSKTVKLQISNTYGVGKIVTFFEKYGCFTAEFEKGQSASYDHDGNGTDANEGDSIVIAKEPMFQQGARVESSSRGVGTVGSVNYEHEFVVVTFSALHEIVWVGCHKVTPLGSGYRFRSPR